MAKWLISLFVMMIITNDDIKITTMQEWIVKKKDIPHNQY